jgi:predicted kinase
MEQNNFTIVIMVGISGSGKSTYIKNNLSGFKIISRDLIRQSLNIMGEDEKRVGSKEEEANVSNIEKKLMLDYCNKRISFVIDDMNLRKKHREQLINFFRKFNPFIRIVYCTAKSVDDCILRRNGQIKSNIIKQMNSVINSPNNIPNDDECDELIISNS